MSMSGVRGNTVTTGAKLMHVLNQIHTYGSFSTGEKVQRYVLPGLTVDGVGRISLPLLPTQAKEIIIRCSLNTSEATPKGSAWTLEPTAFSLSNPEWKEVVNEIGGMTKSGLGINQNIPIHFELHKLLICDTGGFFKMQRAVAKEPGHFGTLTIILPSEYEGGQLAVRHNSDEKQFNFSNSACDNFHFVAFYGDCEYEIKPVTKGYWIALEYTLINASNITVSIPDNSNLILPLQHIIKEWVPKRKPTKYVIFLENKYNAAGLNMNVLKGMDQVRAAILNAAVSNLPKGEKCRILLGIVDIGESGRAARSYSSDQFHMHSDCERTIDIHDLVNFDGSETNFHVPTCSEDQALPEGHLDFLTWDNQKTYDHHSGHGYAMKRWCKATAILIWPKSNDWTSQVEDCYEDAVTEFVPNIKYHSRKSMKRYLRDLLDHHQPAEFPRLVDCCKAIEDMDSLRELLKKDNASQVPHVRKKDDFCKKVAVALVFAAGRLDDWDLIQSFGLKVILNAFGGPPSVTEEPRFEVVIRFLYELARFDFPYGSHANEMCSSLVDMIIGDWTTYANMTPTRLYGINANPTLVETNATLEFAKTLAHLKNPKLVQNFLERIGLGLLESPSTLGSTIDALCGNFMWDILEAPLASIFESAVHEHPLKAADALTRLLISTKDSPHLQSLCTTFAAKLVDLSCSNLQVQVETRHYIFAILETIDNAVLVEKFLATASPDFLAPHLLPPLVLLCLKHDMRKCMPLLLPGIARASFLQLIQFLQTVWSNPLLTLSLTEEEVLVTLKPFIVLAASKPISASNTLDHIFLIFKLSHLIKEDNLLNQISADFVQHYTREHTETIFKLLVELWHWMGEIPGKAMQIPWFVELYNMLASNVNVEYTELGKAPENWSLNVKWKCCFPCDEFIKYCNDNIRREYRTPLETRTINHLNEKIKNFNLGFQTRTVPNFRSKRAVEIFIYTKIYSSCALSRRLDFMQLIVKTLNEMFPSNAPANTDDAPANKKTKLGDQ